MATTTAARPPAAPVPSAAAVARATCSTAELYEDAIRAGEGLVAAEGPLVVRTGKHTGRSPAGQVHRRRAVEPRQDLVGRGQPADQRGALRPAPRAPRRLLRATKDLYAQDCFIGADPAHQRSPARLHRDRLGQHLRPEPVPPADGRRSCAGFAPNFTIICVPSFKADPETEGTRTETAILVHLERMEIIIVGTEYAGEIKKSAFTVMNYLMPDEGVLPMHSRGQRRARTATRRSSSACRGPARRPSPPTRSAASSATTSTAGATAWRSTSRAAATPRRSASRRCTSPTSSRRRGASGRSSRTSTSTRGRASSTSTRSGSPRTPAAPTRSTSSATPTRPGSPASRATVVLLTADAFGVLPPISRLTHDQAAYHFISGYTAKLAGTEVGVKEPKATFSACFGAPFMPRHPGEYAAMLVERLARDDVPVWLVNTGWTGGPYGDRRADEHRPHPVDGPGGARRRARRRPDPDRPELRRRGPDRAARTCRRRSSTRAPTWADPAAYDRGRGAARRDVPRQLRGLRRRRRRRRSPAAGPRQPRLSPDVGQPTGAALTPAPRPTGRGSMASGQMLSASGDHAISDRAADRGGASARVDHRRSDASVAARPVRRRTGRRR